MYLSIIQLAVLVLIMALLVIDWGQTVTIARNPARWMEEENPFLGEHPSVRETNVWFGVWCAVALVLAVLLWDRPAWFFACAAIGGVFEVPCVRDNFKLGIKPWATNQT